MPQQLIYTSAPRGVIAGRSGHCTVARSGSMREALMLQLEKFSYYQHLSLSGGQERPIFCCRVLDIRGSRYHVLTRIHDAGLDFTGRTNFLAHHLIFTPEEVRQFPSPPMILREWPGWLKSWSKDPELFENENWSSLAELAGQKFIPATHWQQLTGDATNGYGLLEARAGIAFRVDDLSDEQILALFAESLELLEFRDPRRDFRASAWQYTFTTSMQEQDNPADFRWRCLHLDNPAANRFAGPDTRALSEVRATRVNNEEAIFACAGRQPPRFITPPQNINCAVGETARLFAKAEGVPSPAYQWFTVDRAGNRQLIAGATTEELSVQNPPLGITRYAIRASNSQGEINSDVVTLAVDPKGTPRPANPAQTPGKPPGAPHIKSESEIEQQRQRLEAEQAQTKKTIRKWPFAILGILFMAGVTGAIVGVIALRPSASKKPSPTPIVQQNDTNVEVSNLKPVSETPEFKKNTDATPARVAKPMNPVNLPFQTTVGSLPSPWKAVQIGKPVAVRTAANIDRSEFLIFGAGENNDNRSDNFFFVRRPMSNSVDFQAELKEAQWLPQRRQGIMIRDSENADAPFAFVGTSQGNLSWMHRDLPAQYTQLAIVPSVHLPVFLRLLKRTNIISAAYSMTGSNWIWLETNEIPFSSRSCLIGFAVSSGDAGQQVGATFDAVSITNH